MVQNCLSIGLRVMANLIRRGETMREVILKDKYLLIRDDGKIFRLDENYNLLDEAKIYVLEGRKKERLYPYVSHTVLGVQNRYTAHHLVANCFVPNPHNYRMVEILDGNPYNLHPSNLSWMAEAERSVKVNKTIKQRSIKCPECGYVYHQNKGECRRCRLAKERERQRIEKLRQPFTHVDSSVLDEHWANVLDKRLKGYKQEEIALEIGVTKQRVGQILKAIQRGEGKRRKVTEQERLEEIGLKMAKEERKK